MDSINRKIKTSLKSIIYYCESPDKIDSASNFVSLIQNTKDFVSKSEVTDSIKERVNKIPKFDLSEIIQQISAYESKMSPYWYANIFAFLRTSKLNDTYIHEINNKFETTKSICQSVIHIIDHPGFEELLENKKST